MHGIETRAQSRDPIEESGMANGYAGSSYEAWHTHGEGACGKLAWTYIRHPDEAGGMESVNVRMPNGSHPAKFSRRLCGSCGKCIGRKSARSLREVPRIE
jgi:hypothetical protein